MSKKITYQVGLGLLSLAIVGANAQAEEDSGMNFRVKAGAASGTYENTYTAGREDEVDFDGLELSAALLFNSGMFVEVKSTALEADGSDVDSNNGIIMTTDEWTRDERSISLGFAAGGGGIVIGYQDNETVYETAAAGDVELNSSGVTFAYGLLGNFGESNFGYNASLGFGVMEGQWIADSVGLDADADYTFGYSLGLGLSYALFDGLVLAADYRLQAYEFEFTDPFGNGGADETIEEVINRFVLSASYTF